jgi:iron complex outermembrane receptor protein
MNLNRWQTLDEFWTVDMKVIGTITNRLSLEVGARNIFDENYQLNAGFPMEGRAFFTVLRMQLS